MTKFLNILIAAVLCSFITACNPVDPQIYQAEKPAFVPEQFFNGKLTSHGIIRNRNGQVMKRFIMQMTANWIDNEASLHEDFVFADGDTHMRDWKIVKRDATHYIGTAPDVVGEAKGEVSGNSLHWIYDIKVPDGQKERVVRFDDWLYMLDDTTMVSFVTIKKFGIRVGDLTMFFQKQPAADTQLGQLR